MKCEKTEKEIAVTWTTWNHQWPRIIKLLCSFTACEAEKIINYKIGNSKITVSLYNILFSLLLKDISRVSKACPSIFNFFTLCSPSQVEQYVNYQMKRYNYSNSSTLTYNYCINTFFFICFNLYLLHCHDEDTLTL